MWVAETLYSPTKMVGKRKADLDTGASKASKKARLEQWLSDVEDSSDSEDEQTEPQVPSDGSESLEEEQINHISHRISPDDEDLDVVKRVRIESRSSQRNGGDITQDAELSVKRERDIVNFTELGVHPDLVTSLANMSIRKPTPVQTACIPALLQGMCVLCHLYMPMVPSGLDCIGNAKTGSGKTVAFAVPILQQLMKDPYGIYALVLTPTRYFLHRNCRLRLICPARELAFQIAEQFAVLGGPFNVRTAIVVGGMDMIAQAIELENRPHVVVGTPGRLVDHLNSTSGTWNLSRVKFLVRGFFQL